MGDDFRYQLPGGGGVRGVDPRVSSEGIVALDLELARTLVTRQNARLFNRIGIAAFTDLAQAFGSSDQPLTGNRLRFVGDAGIGIRAEHRIGDTRFVTRFDLPLFVSRPELAQDRSPGDDKVAFRWVVQLPARALAGLGAVRRTSTVCRSPSSTRVIASPSMAPPSTDTSTTPPSPPSGFMTIS